MLVGAFIRLRRSRRGRWAIGVGYGAITFALAALTARHFATTSWPLSRGDPGLLVVSGLLLLLAQALKAFRGETGESKMRGGRRSVDLSPAAALTLFFDCDAALSSAARCAAAVYDAASLEDANELLHEAGVERTELDWERNPPPGV